MKSRDVGAFPTRYPRFISPHSCAFTRHWTPSVSADPAMFPTPSQASGSSHLPRAVEAPSPPSEMSCKALESLESLACPSEPRAAPQHSPGRSPAPGEGPKLESGSRCCKFRPAQHCWTPWICHLPPAPSHRLSLVPRPLPSCQCKPWAPPDSVTSSCPSSPSAKELESELPCLPLPSLPGLSVLVKTPPNLLSSPTGLGFTLLPFGLLHP